MSEHSNSWSFTFPKEQIQASAKVLYHSVDIHTVVYLGLQLTNGQVYYSVYHNKQKEILSIQMEAMGTILNEDTISNQGYRKLCDYQDLPTLFTVKLTLGTNVVTEALSNCKGFNKILYDNMYNSDVIINVQGASFAAHKWVLSLHSEVFKKMFEADMIEAQKGVIEINDVTPEVFNVFLQCLYTSECDKAVFADNFSELLKMFCMYLVSEMVSSCIATLENRLTTYNAIDVMLILDAHDYKSAKEVAMDFIAKNIIPIMANTDILMRSPDLLREISLQINMKKK